MQNEDGTWSMPTEGKDKKGGRPRTRSQYSDNRPAGEVILGLNVHVVSDDSSAGENPAPVERLVILEEHWVQVQITPIRAGPAAKPFRYDLAIQPKWYGKTFFEQYPKYKDWLDFKSTCRLVRSEEEGRRLTKNRTMCE